MIDLQAMGASVQAAIEATVKADWKDEPCDEEGFSFVVATSLGWTIRVGWADGDPRQDGVASKAGTICHLSPEQSKLVREKAE